MDRKLTRESWLEKAEPLLRGAEEKLNEARKLGVPVDAGDEAGRVEILAEELRDVYTRVKDLLGDLDLDIGKKG